MKRMMLIACLVAAGCGGKKDNKPAAGSGSDMAGSSMAGSGSGATMSGSGSAAGSGATMSGSGSAAGSGSGATMSGSGSGATMSGSGSGSSAAADVPASTDFESEADKDITDKNLEQKLSQMEKDLGQ